MGYKSPRFRVKHLPRKGKKREENRLRPAPKGILWAYRLHKSLIINWRRGSESNRRLLHHPLFLSVCFDNLRFLLTVFGSLGILGHTRWPVFINNPSPRSGGLSFGKALKSSGNPPACASASGAIPVPRVNCAPRNPWLKPGLHRSRTAPGGHGWPDFSKANTSSIRTL